MSQPQQHPWQRPPHSGPLTLPRAKSPSIESLRESLQQAAQHPEQCHKLVETFWQNLPRTPLIEPYDSEQSVVTFLWRATEPLAGVLLFLNAFTRKDQLTESQLERLIATDIWSLSMVMPNSWRASYAFHPYSAAARPVWLDSNDAREIREGLIQGIADPLNPEHMRNRSGRPQSVITLPAAPAQPWLQPRNGPRAEAAQPIAGPAGKQLWVWRPEGSENSTLPLLIACDGDVWTSSQNLVTTVNNLIHDREIPPLMLVMVDHSDLEERWKELSASGDGSHYLARVLLPWLRERYRLSTNAAEVIVAGQSLGGLTALNTVLHYPNLVGAALSQSASLWQELALPHPLPQVRAYLEVGSYETILLEPNRVFRDNLVASGSHITYVEYTGGHDYACWRGGIAQGLRALLPR